MIKIRIIKNIIIMLIIRFQRIMDSLLLLLLLLFIAIIIRILFKIYITSNSYDINIYNCFTSKILFWWFCLSSLNILLLLTTITTKTIIIIIIILPIYTLINQIMTISKMVDFDNREF